MIKRSLLESNRSLLKVWLLKNPMVVLWNDDHEAWIGDPIGNCVNDIGDALCIPFARAIDEQCDLAWMSCIEIDMKTMRKYKSALKYAAKLRDNLMNDWRKISPRGVNFDE